MSTTESSALFTTTKFTEIDVSDEPSQDPGDSSSSLTQHLLVEREIDRYSISRLLCLFVERFFKICCMLLGVGLGWDGAIRALLRHDDMNAFLALSSTVGSTYLIVVYVLTKIKSLQSWSAFAIRVNIYAHVSLALLCLFAATCTMLICVMLELNGLAASDWWEATLWLLLAFIWECAAWTTLRRYVLRFCGEKVRLASRNSAADYSASLDEEDDLATEEWDAAV